ncbi:exodeoxyribonuclease III [Waterburya agarophytonicola K14]|uniref:Exodeoxyribonuclease III n=1 Tax=Waterburya agarophytonicola KI4 TaxID=2874699 RepID=A0A964BPZ5_9CYAN|nr:exodeoxyribonuclease III [Waterburya agarophytonicola]MCC0176676.1 exodeoxyribonuclease III [Waterburya agarophytonicola KI4]
MRVATWNVNSIRSRQQIVIDWLQQHQVDVLCLQETKVQDHQFPRSPFEDLGYKLYISGQKSYNGVAIFSLKPLEKVSCGFSPIIGDIAADFDEQKRVISGILDGVRIVNLYVPNGSSLGSDKYEYKLSWLELLGQYLQKLQTEKREISVCGDFNIALEDKDIYTAKNREKHIMSSPVEREALNKVLALGFQDVFRKFNPEEGHFSWWDYRAGGFIRNRGWRIDHHYLTDKLYQQAIKCWIDPEPRKLEKPSDHTPVILEF